jgi:putative transposase
MQALLRFATLLANSFSTRSRATDRPAGSPRADPLQRHLESQRPLGDSTALGGVPGASIPRYLLLDRDSVFSPEVMGTIRSFGIDPVRTAYRSPWQDPVAERWIGTCRRELLDRVIVFGERHLRCLLADYVACYNAERVDTRLGDSPEGRPTETRPSPAGSVVGVPRVGGLHHRYVWAAAT